MYPVFESIKVVDDQVFHFDHHLNRMKNTVKALWNKEAEFSLLKSAIEKNASKGLQKCRVYYNESNFRIECMPYVKRTITKLNLVNDDEIEYNFKYADRYCLTKHVQGLSAVEDIILIKNKQLTDTSFANIALWNGAEWHTPFCPLFHGIRRSLLVDRGLLIEKSIVFEDLSTYKKISLINAMLDLGELELDVDNILY